MLADDIRINKMAINDIRVFILQALVVREKFNFKILKLAN